VVTTTKAQEFAATGPFRRGGGPATPKPRTIKDTPTYRAFTAVNVVILVLVVVLTLFPFVNLFAKAFSDAIYINLGQVTFWPKGWNTETLGTVMGHDVFWLNYRNTIMYTVLGTVIALVMTSTYAFALSRRQLVGRGFFTGLAVFTMFFQGGLIPNYVLIQQLHLMNTVWAILLPASISVFNLLVMKSFFENFPTELEEAARIDGVGTYGVFFRIVLPLSKAVIAAMTLFYAVAFWNSWFPASLYLTRAPELRPVSLFLRNLIVGSKQGGGEFGAGNVDNVVQVAANVKSVSMLLVIVPIICLYPFLQKYFVSGVMLGAVKQ
jgi:putative aldouronate transport system permease protein